GEFDFVFTSGKIQFLSDRLAAESETQQWAVGCKCVSALERIKPCCCTRRISGNTGIDASQANRPTKRGIIRHSVRARSCRQTKSAIEQAVPDRRGHAVIA